MEKKEISTPPPTKYLRQNTATGLINTEKEGIKCPTLFKLKVYNVATMKTGSSRSHRGGGFCSIIRIISKNNTNSLSNLAQEARKA